MLTAGQVVGRYVVEGQVGSGSMGEVYEVRHLDRGTQHAMKYMPLPSQSVRDRLLLEAQALAGLSHPNVVTLTEVVDVQGDPGLVMELVQGPSLKDWLEMRTVADPHDAEILFRGILAGVSHAHRRGLVHRDLKPSNVLLANTDTGLVPKVADFGIAKRPAWHDEDGRHLTRTGASLGSPAYMAPEQIRDARGVDARADLFSLGCMLYELVTGQRAFAGGDPLLVMNAVTNGAYKPVQEWVPDAPARLVRVIDACLIADRELRVQSCEALIELLGPPEVVQPEVSSSPAPALRRRTPSPTSPLREATPTAPMQRPAPPVSPLVVGTVTAVLVFVVLGSIVAAWAWLSPG